MPSFQAVALAVGAGAMFWFLSFLVSDMRTHAIWCGIIGAAIFLVIGSVPMNQKFFAPVVLASIGIILLLIAIALFFSRYHDPDAPTAELSQSDPTKKSPPSGDTLSVGKGSTVYGNVKGNVGDDSVVVGPTDGHGKTIINEGAAIGNGAHACKDSIAIGKGAHAGPDSCPPSKPE